MRMSIRFARLHNQRARVAQLNELGTRQFDRVVVRNGIDVPANEPAAGLDRDRVLVIRQLRNPIIDVRHTESERVNMFFDHIRNGDHRHIRLVLGLSGLLNRKESH